MDNAKEKQEKSFFDENKERLLKIIKVSTKTEKDSGSLRGMLNKFKINGKAATYCMNELKFGLYADGQFIFADGGQLEEKYLLQLRIFNENEELLLQRNGDEFLARCIVDTPDENGAQECADCKSPLFGSRDTAADLPHGFVRLLESGRKMSMIIPTDETAKNYLLRTRSYIVYDEKTGQAGYGFWRFAAIEAR